MKTYVNYLMVAFLLLTSVGFSQNTINLEKKKIAVLGIDARDVSQETESIAHLIRLKLQKTDRYAVFRHYDVIEELKDTDLKVETCYSIKCLSAAGKALGADHILAGTVERFGERIIISLILIDVPNAAIIKSDVNEYFYFPNQLEGMITISINNILEIENDPQMVNQLVKQTNVLEDQAIERLKLNGPRMGLTYVGGVQGQRLRDPKSQGGYDMLPIMSQFGYQFEFQYMSAGNIQALVEIIPMITGMDQGRFIPSVTMMNGFRHSKSGIEFAFGPTFRISQVADGFYNSEGVWTQTGEWHEQGNTGEIPYEVQTNIDSKGWYKGTFGFTLAAGKTFSSGHLHMPVNVFFTPARHGFNLGASFGFNVRTKNRLDIY